MMSAAPAPSVARVVFFDLGDTLVRQVGASPAALDFAWVSGAREALAGLQERGLRLGLISNTGTLQRPDLARMLPADFDFARFEDALVLLSAEVGIAKPDVRIFELALERAQSRDAGPVDPAACLYCGEDARESLVAQRAGMRSLRVDGAAGSEIGRLVETLIAAGMLTN